jgi:hypothetical protein
LNFLVVPVTSERVFWALVPARAGVAIRHHDLVHQILAVFATEDRVGNRQRLGATDDCEFHDLSP